MYRFVSFVSDSRPLRDFNVLPDLTKPFTEELGWSCAMDASTLRVFHAGVRAGRDDAVRLPNNHGVVLGAMFPRESGAPFSRPVTRIDERSAPKDRDALFREMTRGHWGRYVAFSARTDQNEPAVVLRAPLGSLPCYYVRHQGVWIFFSHLEDLSSIPSLTLRINWDFVKCDLAPPTLIGPDTGLSDVSELCGGQRAVISSSGLALRSDWTPGEFMHADGSPSLSSTEAEFRAATTYCIRSWGELYDRVTVSCSGGIDSSLVLACLAEGDRKKIACYTFFTQTADADERYYCRLLARRYGLDVAEVEIPFPALDAPLEEGMPLVPRSEGDVFSIDLEEAIIKALPAADREVVFTGNSGDEVFYSAPDLKMLVDYLHTEGFNRGLFTAASDLSTMSNKSYRALMTHTIWTLLTSSPRRMRQARFWPLGNPLISFSPDEARSRLRPHPWLADLTRSLPAKSQHVAAMSRSTRLSRLSRRHAIADHLDPLLSQPLVEHAISTPTYVLMKGGLDRARIRSAFRDRIPSEILDRRHKGSPMHLAPLFIKNKEARFCEYLKTGLLMKQGLLNEERVARIASMDVVQEPLAIISVMKTIVVEAWLRRVAAAFPIQNLA